MDRTRRQRLPRYASKKARARIRPSRRARFEALEPRLPLAAILVTSVGDSIAVDGVVTLREAITAANTNAPVGDAPAGDPGNDTISFDIAGSGPHVIAPASPLPAIVDTLSIDGTTEPDYAGTPVIELNGALAGNADGLALRAGSSGSSVEGLSITGFALQGVVATDSGGHTIRGNLLGLKPNGTTPEANRNGVLLIGSHDNVIEGNTATGNVFNGVVIIDGSTGNEVSNNILGLDAAGSASVFPNHRNNGLIVIDSFGTSVSDNTISGNGFSGINVIRSDDSTIDGNKIGTDVNGTLDRGNGSNGIILNVAASSVISNNLLSGNDFAGVNLFRSSNAQIFGNLIGTDVSGTSMIPNQVNGIAVQSNSIDTHIEDNLISGNGFAGVNLFQSSNTQIRGNLIGTDVNGAFAIGNGRGIAVQQSSQGTVIGGDTPSARNVISGNSSYGIGLFNDSTDTLIEGNYIGTDVTGELDLGNGGDGVSIFAAGNVVRGNVISGNSSEGVLVSGDANQIEGNFIGTNQGGTAILGGRVGNNNFEGIELDFGSGNIVIGNVLSGNTNVGIEVNASNTVVRDNVIGLDVTGTNDLGNWNDGVLILNAEQTSLESNLISSNLSGVNVRASHDTTLKDNRIGTDIEGRIDLGNRMNGVIVQSSSGNTVVDDNLISGNDFAGINIFQSRDTQIRGNLIGTDVNGAFAIGNGKGIAVQQDPEGTVIGGDSASARNLISGNSDYGIGLFNGSTNTLVEGNYIGTDITGELDLGNAGNGVDVFASGNVVRGNVISGNSGDGVFVGGDENRIENNFIGTNKDGTAIIGVLPEHNNRNGIWIDSNVSGTVVTANVVSGNSSHGIRDYGGLQTIVRDNIIGLDVTGTVDLGNHSWGVNVWASAQLTTLVDNLISGNSAGGIYLEGIRIPPSPKVIEGNYVGTDITGELNLGNGGPGIKVQQDGNTISNNVVSGNDFAEVFIDTGIQNKIENNFIGTNKDGTAALGGQFDNNSAGIFMVGGRIDFRTRLRVPDENIITGNVVSGNGSTGIYGERGILNVVRDNIVGLDATGLAGIGNGGDGISLTTDFGGNTVEANLVSFNGGDGINNSGGTVEANLVSSNGGDGINSFGSTVEANWVSSNGGDGIVSVSGTVEANLVSSNGGDGINSRGGKVEANLVSSNGGDGIYISGGGKVEANSIWSNGSNGIQVLGYVEVLSNRIGINQSGEAAGNAGNGILVTGGNLVPGGGFIGDPESPNEIFFNGGAGVAVYSPPPTPFGQSYTHVSIRGNHIGKNGGLGIDIYSEGPTPLSRKPIPVLSKFENGASTRVVGAIDTGRPSAELVTIDFYGNKSIDPTFFGEGERYLGSFDLMTDGFGKASFDVTLPVPTDVGELITSTATYDTFNTNPFYQVDGTSEFSEITSELIAASLSEPTLLESGELFVVGTNDDDEILVKEKNGSVEVKIESDDFDAKHAFPAADVGRVFVFALAGDDEVNIHKTISLDAFVLGGDGDDQLSGGQGRNVLVGGNGDDEIIGNHTLDIIIGGWGEDEMNGKDGDDLLIGGSTNADESLAALDTLLSDWNDRDLPSIFSTLVVSDDEEEDELHGAAGADLFWDEIDDELSDVDSGEGDLVVVP